MVEGLSAVLLAFHGIFTLALNARFASPLAQSDQPMNECLLVTINCFTLVICAISMPPLPHSLLAIILGAAGDFIFRVLPLVIYVMPLHAYCLLTCEALLFSPSLHPPSGLLSHPLLLPSTYLRVARDPALSKKAECLL